jgi:hypothetical protein
VAVVAVLRTAPAPDAIGASGLRSDIHAWLLISYHADALTVTEPVANWTVSPLATPVMLLVRAPWSHRSGVAAVSQISMDVIVAQEPVALHDTALLLVCDPAEAVPNAVDPRVEPPAV